MNPILPLKRKRFSNTNYHSNIKISCIFHVDFQFIIINHAQNYVLWYYQWNKYFFLKNFSITKISVCKLKFISSLTKYLAFKDLQLYKFSHVESKQFPEAPPTHSTQNIVPCKALYLDEFGLLFGIIPEHVQQTLPGDGS